jgi:hypothetical protein
MKGNSNVNGFDESVKVLSTSNKPGDVGNSSAIFNFQSKNVKERRIRSKISDLIYSI